MSRKPMTEEQFYRAKATMEKRTKNITAAVIIDPRNVDRWGKVQILYGRNGGNKLNALAWLPGNGTEKLRHYGWATGYGYDKATAAMEGAEFVDCQGKLQNIMDAECAWDRQLREEEPSKETIEHFDSSVDGATHTVIEQFEWVGLPEGDQLGSLMVELNNAIAAIMREWL